MLRRFEHEIDLVRLLVRKELKLRYKNTFLGYFWSILHPMGLMLVYFFAFKIVAGIDTGPVPYALVLVSGIFPWMWFTNSVLLSNGTFVGSANLIKKARFRRWLLVLATVLNDALHFLVSLPVIAVFMLAFGWRPNVGWLIWGPILLCITGCIALGLALVTATCNLIFRDLERLSQLLLTMWFFLTPVMFTREILNSLKLGWLEWINPMAAIILSWRDVLLYGTPDPVTLATGAVWSVAILIVGTLVYRRMQGRFAELV
jgi:lipopolysaccharide transport system permease protein